MIHNPIFSAGKTHHGDNKGLQKVILLMFEKYKVDIVLTGHDHSAQYLHMDMIEQSQGTTFFEEQMRTTLEDCILEEFIKHDESSKKYHRIRRFTRWTYVPFCPRQWRCSQLKILSIETD